MMVMGGIMIFVIGLNLFSIIKIKVVNLFLGILVVGVIVLIIYGYGLLVN